jgi:hypothetical protein
MPFGYMEIISYLSLMEKWKYINNDYLVSNLGKVKSLPRNGTINAERILKHKINKVGYNSVYIGKWKLVHRLVAEAFITNSDNKPFVDHIDNNKSNNSIDNLRWVTMEENNKHRYDCGRANQYTLYNQKNKP